MTQQKEVRQQLQQQTVMLIFKRVLLIEIKIFNVTFAE
jgi:hypothetical protein